MESKRRAHQQEGPSKKPRLVSVSLPKDVLPIIFGHLFAEVYAGSFLLPQVCKEWKKIWESLEDVRFFTYALARKGRDLMIASVLLRQWEEDPGAPHFSCRFSSPMDVFYFPYYTGTLDPCKGRLLSIDPKTVLITSNGIPSFALPTRGSIVSGNTLNYQPKTIVGKILKSAAQKYTITIEDSIMKELQGNVEFRREALKIFKSLAPAGLF